MKRKCPYCDTEFEFGEIDIDVTIAEKTKTHPTSRRLTTPDIYLHNIRARIVECPACKHKNILKELDDLGKERRVFPRK